MVALLMELLMAPGETLDQGLLKLATNKLQLT
jgi:hypothetical protein